MVMAWISAVVLVEHAFLSWLLILKLGWGLPGAALVLNSSWWLIVIAQLIYIFKTKSDGAWSGFSWLAFQDLFGFVKLSLSSALMLWYVFPPFSFHCFLMYKLSKYGTESFFIIIIFFTSICLMQFGVLVLDDFGGHNRPFAKSFGSSRCNIYLVTCFFFSLNFSVKNHHVGSLITSLISIWCLQYEYKWMGRNDCTWVQCCNKVDFPLHYLFPFMFSMYRDCNSIKKLNPTAWEYQMNLELGMPRLRNFLWWWFVWHPWS